MPSTDGMLVVATDGACPSNPGPGGWAWAPGTPMRQLKAQGRYVPVPRVTFYQFQDRHRFLKRAWFDFPARDKCTGASIMRFMAGYC